MIVSLPGMVTEVSCSQYLNVSSEMDVSVLGNTTFDRLSLQCCRISPIDVMPSPNVTEEMLGQLRNGLLPNFVTVPGKETEAKEEQL